MRETSRFVEIQLQQAGVTQAEIAAALLHEGVPVTADGTQVTRGKLFWHDWDPSHPSGVWMLSWVDGEPGNIDIALPPASAPPP